MDYLTAYSFTADFGPVLWGIRSYYSDVQMNSAIYTQTVNDTIQSMPSYCKWHITLWLFHLWNSRKLHVFSKQGHSDSGTDIPNPSDSFLFISFSHMLFKWEHRILHIELGLVIRLISYSSTARRTMSLSGLVPTNFSHFFICFSCCFSLSVCCVVFTSFWEPASSWKAAKKHTYYCTEWLRLEVNQWAFWHAVS